MVAIAVTLLPIFQIVAKVFSIEAQTNQYGKKIVISLITSGVVQGATDDVHHLSQIEFLGPNLICKVDPDVWTKKFSTQVSLGRVYQMSVICSAWKDKPIVRLIRVGKEYTPGSSAAVSAEGD